MLEYIKSKISYASSYLSKKYLLKESYRTLLEWDKQRKQNIKQHPIKYFLIEECLGNFSYIIERLIEDPIYHLKSKYIIKWHYVKIDVQRFITNNNSYDKYKLFSYNYIDSVNIMLYSNFQILVNFVEHEGFQTDWATNNIDIWNEINILYIWWIKGRYDEEKPYNSPKFSDYDINKNIYNEYINNTLPVSDTSFHSCEEFKLAYDLYIDIPENQYKKEEEMLIRLIKIRRYLWS